MAAKFKMTGFARFLLALIVIIPGAYIGASYIKGEDGIENAKKLIGISNTSKAPTNTSADKDNNTCELQVKSLQKQVKNLREENERLRSEIDNLQK